MPFDFSNLTDLNLTDDEKMTMSRIYQKSLTHFNPSIWTQGRQGFFESFVRCLRVAILANAVPSVVAAQAILESGWFSTGILFGVKSTYSQEQSGQDQAAVTHEVVNGKVITITGDFFKGTIQQQFGNYYVYLQDRKPGSSKFLPADAGSYISYLQDGTVLAVNGKESGAYATDPNYIEDIMSIVRDNDLTVFDHV